MSAAGAPKCSRIRHVARLRHLLRRWRQKAAASHRWVPADLPAGHVAVAVGTSGRRFVVRATHLNHPVFRKLLDRAEEEYGFANRPGPLPIPCDEVVFEQILRFVGRFETSSRFEDSKRCCHVGESQPLLYAKSVW